MRKFYIESAVEECPAGYLGDGDDVNGSGCTAYIEEDNAGELFNSEVPYFNDWTTLKKYYQIFGREYDFIVFFPTKTTYNYSSAVHREIGGINQTPLNYTNFPESLMSFAVIAGLDGGSNS